MLALLEVLIGIVVGYFAASMGESFFHRHIGHAGPRLMRLWKRYPRLFNAFLRAHFSHKVVHHEWTYRESFALQFRDDADRQRVEERIPEPWRKAIIADQFGASVSGFIGWFMFAAPTAVFALPLIWLVLGVWALLGACLPVLIVFPAMSKFLHPHIHDQDTDQQQKCPWLVKVILSTSFMKAVARAHDLHHDDQDCNFNLLPLCLGDRVLGVYREPEKPPLPAKEVA